MRNGVLLCIFCGQTDSAQMPFTLRFFQYMVTNALRLHQYTFSVRNLLMSEKVLLSRNDLATASIVFLHQKLVDTWDKYLHKFGRYVKIKQ